MEPFRPKRTGVSPAIDQVLVHNRAYAQGYSLQGLSAPPAKRIAMVGCMDARINPVTSLGLAYGDAHILRNAGAVVTPDVHRSLIVSTQKLGVREIMVIGHTKCGMMGFDGADFRSQLEEKYGPHPYAPPEFYTFADLALNVQRQVKIVHDCPWIHPEAVVRGFVFDVDTGALAEI